MNKLKLSFLSFFFLFSWFSVNSYAAPVYKVEVLIFENTAGTEIDNEQWPELKETPSTFDTVPVTQRGEGLFKELPSSALNLIQVRNKLEKSDKYHVLYHHGWTQPVFTKDESTAAWIEIPGVLAGKINLYKNRYLHVSADLQFNSTEGVVRLKENRRLKSKELNYLDHPLFGLLIRVVKL